MAVIRPIAAVTSAITAGLLVGKDDEPPKCNEPPAESCCASKKPVVEDSCCGSNAAKPKQAENPMFKKIKAGLRFTFIDLVKDIALWLIIGIGFAAIIKTYVPNEFLAQWGDGLLAFIVMAVIGVPMYICATASTPIAAGLLFSGVSPGAVLVFMLVGPATNIATVGLVKRELGNRALAAYLSSVVGVGFAFGFLTNYLANAWDMNFLAQAEHAHEMLNTPLAYAASILLATLMSYSLIKKYIIKE